jgi:hypothetical protein
MLIGGVTVRRTGCGGARAWSGRSGGQCSADINKAGARVNNSGSHCIAKQSPVSAAACQLIDTQTRPRIYSTRQPTLLSVHGRVVAGLTTPRLPR